MRRLISLVPRPVLSDSVPSSGRHPSLRYHIRCQCKGTPTNAATRAHFPLPLVRPVVPFSFPFFTTPTHVRFYRILDGCNAIQKTIIPIAIALPTFSQESRETEPAIYRRQTIDMGEKVSGPGIYPHRHPHPHPHPHPRHHLNSLLL